MSKRWHACLILSFRKGVVYHWHWPKKGIVNCTNAIEHAELRDGR
jgi:hypothetical protein